MQELTDEWIKSAYDTNQAGRERDGDEMGRMVGNPWLVNITKAYKSSFGRMPTKNEVMAAIPAFQNYGGSGEAYIAQLADAEQNSPDKVRERKEAELASKAPEKYGDVDAIYQELYKRGANQGEMEHFGKMLASGEVDPYELRTFVMSQPEYQAGQDKEFRAGLADELGTYDTQVFDREKENVISRYSQMGRTGSSSLDFALTDLMGKIGQERSRYLATVGAQQYEGNKSAAREDYRTNLDRMFSGEDYDRTRTDQINDLLRGRLMELEDYNTEKANYGSGKRATSPGANAFSGAAGGAAIGGSVGGPYGAAAGAVGGGLFGYFNS